MARGIDDLSDEEVLKLSPSEIEAYGVAESEEEVEENEDPEETLEEDEGEISPDGSNPEPEGEDLQEEKEEQDPPEEGSEELPEDEPEPSSSDEPEQPVPSDTGEEKDEGEKGEKPQTPSKPEDDPKAKKGEGDPKPDDVKSSVAEDFYKKVSEPFKADGKTIQIRSPEDAIRLMQMGVNYSRRMEEMKPMRAIDTMLRQHGLNNPEKINELIDISKGNVDAIQKLLKDKNIDPLDIDTSKDTPYKATNYQADPKDVAFQEAIETTMAAEGGMDLIKDVNKNWDNESKEALRDQPVIFQNILDQKQSGVYEQIKTELEYQRTMGFLTNIPFLQAYHQVGDAMQKAGVFDKGQQQQVHSGGVRTPIDTGTRKAVQPKNDPPNPNLSSTKQPRVAPQRTAQKEEPDYSSMSDEEFLKLSAPS